MPGLLSNSVCECVIDVTDGVAPVPEKKTWSSECQTFEKNTCIIVLMCINIMALCVTSRAASIIEVYESQIMTPIDNGNAVFLYKSTALGDKFLNVVAIKEYSVTVKEFPPNSVHIGFNPQK